MESNDISNKDIRKKYMLGSASLKGGKKKQAGGKRGSVFQFICENKTAILMTGVSLALLVTLLYFLKKNKELKVEVTEQCTKAAKSNKRFEEYFEKYTKEYWNRVEIVKKMTSYANKFWYYSNFTDSQKDIQTNANAMLEYLKKKKSMTVLLT